MTGARSGVRGVGSGLSLATPLPIPLAPPAKTPMPSGVSGVSGFSRVTSLLAHEKKVHKGHKNSLPGAVCPKGARKKPLTPLTPLGAFQPPRRPHPSGITLGNDRGEAAAGTAVAVRAVAPGDARLERRSLRHRLGWRRPRRVDFR